MSFKSKTDYYGLNTTGIELVGTTENKTASVAEAQSENGFVVANYVYGERNAPACDYIITGRSVSLVGITLGAIHEVDDKSYCISEIGITTGAGQVPSMNVAGQQVEDDATVACTAQLTAVSVTGLHHAQNFGAFTFSGTGAHLTQSSYSAKCTINTAEKDGVIKAHDITDGRIEVNGTIQVSDSSYGTPTLSAQTGWIVTSPLTETNPNADFPTYTFTVTKYLTATEPSS